MLRFFAGAGAMLLLMAAAFFIWKSRAEAEPDIPPAPAAPPLLTPVFQQAPVAPPEAEPKSREEKRFDRADKDKNGQIARSELLEPRRKPFAKLDVDGDGRLSFDEWAVRTSDKFAGADANRDGQLTRDEFATTAPKRRAKPACDC